MRIPKLNTSPHVCTIRLVSTAAPPSSHQLSFTGHMQTVNTVAPLHSLAFCLYFLRQNNGYKRQSGKNKIWCKAQILVPEDWLNWPGGLVKKKKKQPRREGEHYYWPTSAPRMCQCFNNFLQASWPLALVLLHTGRRAALLSWSQICIVFALCFMRKICLGGHLGRNITEGIKRSTLLRRNASTLQHLQVFPLLTKWQKIHSLILFIRQQIPAATPFSFNLSSQSHSLNNECVCVCVRTRVSLCAYGVPE